MSDQLVLSEEEALELVAYLLACADSCRREPMLYGSGRLLKGASRLAAVVQTRTEGATQAFWQRIHDEVEKKAHWRHYAMDEWNKFVEQMPVLVVDEVKRRAESEE